MARNQLRTLPADIFTLPVLYYFSFWQNPLGNISDSLLLLPHLEYVNLMQCELRTINSQLLEMPSVNLVNLSGNHFSATLQRNLKKLAARKKIVLESSNNKCSKDFH